MANKSASNLLQCPITMEIFDDPVLAKDGYTYERQAIEQWILSHGTSPMTRQPLSLNDLCPNRKVKELIEVFEKTLHDKKHEFILGVDVKKKTEQPIFKTNFKKIYSAEWVAENEKRPEIVILKLTGARARKEASFYVDLTRHQHIVRTFGFVHDRNNPDENDSISLLQEYAPEGSLDELLQERWRVPEENALVQIFLQITEAMIYLTSNHVVHADLACRNVLVFRFDKTQPEKNIIKITDFGLSRHSHLYSRTSGVAGTTLNIIPNRYAAPELLSTNVTALDYTEKSDIYSIGVLMWEAYSGGAIPWVDIDDEEVIRRVRKGDILSQPSNCSQPFWSIIKTTWSRSPADRPTFMQLKSHLNRQYYRSGSFS